MTSLTEKAAPVFTRSPEPSDGGATRKDALAGAAPSSWQSIETALKNGTRILLWPRIANHNSKPHFLRHAIGYWHKLPEGGGVWAGCDAPRKPTHWMPLPEPPALSSLPEGELK